MRLLLASSPHRVACLALYRSHLKHAQALPDQLQIQLKTSSSSSPSISSNKKLSKWVGSYIKAQWRKSRHLSNREDIRKKLVKGYIDDGILRRAVTTPNSSNGGSNPDLEQIRGRVIKIIEERRPWPESLESKMKKEANVHKSTTVPWVEKMRLRKERARAERKAARGEKRSKVLSKICNDEDFSFPSASYNPLPPHLHPLFNLHKKLRQPRTFITPSLSDANGFPYLHWKGSKGTPTRVAMTIKSKIKNKQKRFDQGDLMQEYREYAAGEDIFDGHVSRVSWVPLIPPGMAGEIPKNRVLGRCQGRSPFSAYVIESTWESDSESVIQYLFKLQRASEVRNKGTADKFFEIVRIAEEKKEWIKTERRRKRRRRRLWRIRRREMWVRGRPRVIVSPGEGLRRQKEEEIDRRFDELERRRAAREKGSSSDSGSGSDVWEKGSSGKGNSEAIGKAEDTTADEDWLRIINR